MSIKREKEDNNLYEFVFKKVLYGKGILTFH